MMLWFLAPIHGRRVPTAYTTSRASSRECGGGFYSSSRTLVYFMYWPEGEGAGASPLRPETPGRHAYR